MDDMYRIRYEATEAGAICQIYKYSIVDEKATYYVLQSGRCKKRVKKDSLGEIRKKAAEPTVRDVFVMDLTKKQELIQQMAEDVKASVLQKVQQFQKIAENAVACDCDEILDVEA